MAEEPATSQKPPDRSHEFLAAFSLIMHSPYASVMVLGVVLALLIVAATYGLSSPDRKDLLLEIYRDPKLAWLGWLLFLGSIVTFVGVLTWMRRSSQGEIRRLTGVNEKLKLELRSQEPTLPYDGKDS